MNLILNRGSNTYDITKQIDGVEWSGDYQQVSRKLVLNSLYPSNDENQDVIVFQYGDIVVLYDDDSKELFRGYVFFIDLDSTSQFANITCYDALVYLTTSEMSYNFKNMSPEAVTKHVCKNFFVPIGKLATTGVTRNYIATQKAPYDIIIAAYTHASTVTGKKYLPRIEKGVLNVIEKGSTICPVKLDERSNLKGSVFNSNLQAMVNKVVIYDDQNNVVGHVENQSDIDKYGLFQKSVTYEKDKDNYAIAKKALMPIEKKAQVTALGHVKAITGNAVYVYDSVTNLTAKFFVDSDTHTWKQGLHEMTLTISFKNIMDEKEIESELQSQSQD